MDTRLIEFLNSHRVDDRDKTTHTSALYPTGSFVISTEQDKKRFHMLYCNGVIKKRVMGLTERPNNRATPLRADIDFKFSLNDYTPNDDPIPRATIEQIIRYYQIAIEEVVDENDFDPKMQICILLEKPTRYRVHEGVLKTGFHLHFPFFVTKSRIQNKVIRNRVIRYVEESRLFSKVKLLEKLEIVFDEVANKCWVMYGSYRIDRNEAYLITKCYDAELHEMTVEDVFYDELTALNAKRKKKMTYRYDLPVLMSILDKEYLEAKLKPKYTSMLKNMDVKLKRIRHTKSEEQIVEELKFIQDAGFMDMLNNDRAEDYNKWMEVGWTLFCIGEGHPMALNMWLDFSSRCIDKYDENECIKRWNDMENRGKTIASLKMMAQIDSPEEYREWKRTYIHSHFDEAMRYAYKGKDYNSHYPIAEILHSMYDNFVCANSKKDIWYKFDNHRWNLIDDGMDLKTLLSIDVRRAVASYKTEVSRRAEELHGEERDKMNDNVIKLIKIDEALTKVPFVNKVVEAAKTYFYDRKFLLKLDENKSLLGFENGIYDLDAGIFREGRPDDYVSYSCGRYYHKYNWNDLEIREVDDYLEKVFVNEKLRQYFKDFICSCLKGGNQNKRFVVFTGDGDNGKSITVMLLELVFGDYAWKFEQELLVRGRGNSSGAARPELAQVRGRRIAFVDEIPKNKEIDIGVLKKLTGNDSFFARLLHDNGGIIKPMFTLVLQCNALPKIPAHDEPTWNRTRVLDYESNFVDEPPKDKKKQVTRKTFKKDRDFAERLEDMADPLMWILLENYKSYKKKGLKEPEEVVASTLRYKEDNDIFLQFINECLIKSDDKKATITVSQMHIEFSAWFKQNYPEYNNKKDQIGLREMRTEMSTRKRLGKPRIKGKTCFWEGWKFSEISTEEGVISDEYTQNIEE